MQRRRLCFEICVARKLSPFDDDVVSSVDFRKKPEFFHRADNNIVVLVHVVIRKTCYEREIEITFVVENRAAARRTPCKETACVVEFFNIHVKVCVLVSSDDDRVVVAPKINDKFAVFRRVHKRALESKIIMRIKPACFNISYFIVRFCHINKLSCGII